MSAYRRPHVVDDVLRSPAKGDLGAWAWTVAGSVLRICLEICATAVLIALLLGVPIVVVLFMMRFLAGW